MVAPAYSEARHAMAKTIGLGCKAGQQAERAAKQVRKSGKAALNAAKKALGSDT